MTGPLHTGADWWRQAVVYQVYPRSFADANGDGLGDLAGITRRIPHLVDLGVDAVWLSPFYPSALADGGYDVDDHRDVDPKIGTLAEFDALVEALHTAGLKLIVDIVPNHSSDRHPWFRAALAAGPGPPNASATCSGSAPTVRPRTGPPASAGPRGNPSATAGGTCTCSPPEQPDWNWDHPDVREDHERTLRFWADRGVDGFRIDVAHYLTKDLTGPLPTQAEIEAGTVPEGTHPFNDRDDVHEVYRSWRKVFDQYDPPKMAVAEAVVPTHRRPRYASAEGLGQAFNFDLLEADFDAAQFRAVVEQNLDLAASAGSTSTWVLSNHDVVRHPSRYALPTGRRSRRGCCRTARVPGPTSPRVAAGAGGHRVPAGPAGVRLPVPG